MFSISTLGLIPICGILKRLSLAKHYYTDTSGENQLPQQSVCAELGPLKPT